MTMPGVPSTPQWLIQEDLALKLKLLNYPGDGRTANFFVENYSDGRQFPIEVYFRFPDQELQKRTFPHIAIDLIDLQPEEDRAHRANNFIVPVDLELATPPLGGYLGSYDFPMPWSLIYQLSCFSRDPWHDRQLTALLYTLFPDQFGAVDMSNFDGTVRRADFVSANRRDTIDSEAAGGKRLYRLNYTIAMSSQKYLGEIFNIAQVNSIAINYALILDNVSVPVGSSEIS